VRTLSFSPDGQRLASAGWDGTVRVWDLRPLAPAPAVPRPVLAAFSKDFGRAAVLTGDDGLRVLDTANGAELYRAEPLPHLSESVVALSPDGSRLAYSPRPGVRDRHLVFVRSLPDGNLVHEFEVPAYVNEMTFSPDGQELSVTTGAFEVKDRGIVRADLTNRGQTAWAESASQWGASSLAYSPDGRSFVAGFEHGKIRVWDRQTGRPRQPLVGHSDRVNCLAFSPDSRRLVSGGRSDRTVNVWDFADGRLLVQLGGHERGVFRVAIHPDGGLVASLGGEGDLTLWDVHATAEGPAAAFRGQQVIALDGAKGLREIGFSPDGQRLLGGTPAGEVVTWEGSPPPSRRTLRGHGNKVNPVGFSPDGRLLASVGGELKWWDVASGQALFSGERLMGQFVLGMAFRPDGRQLALGVTMKTVQVWDLAGATKVADLDSKVPVRRLAFSPEGGLLAAWCDDRAVVAWELPSGRERFRVAAAVPGVPELLAFSADGRHVVLTDLQGRRLAWEAAAGRPVPAPADFRPAAPPTTPFSPDGSLMAAVEDDMIHLVALDPVTAELERRRAAARTDVGWQRRQALRHEAAKNWFAAAAHWGVLLRERPEDAELRSRRERAIRALEEERKK
jgi:WD40 repeat protein